MSTRSFYATHAVLVLSMLGFGYSALSLADGTYRHQSKLSQESFSSIRGMAGRVSLTFAEAGR